MPSGCTTTCGSRYGVVLDGELLTPIPGYQGLVRLKAAVLRQVDPFRIEGYEGAVTTSRLGVPRYWLQSGNFTYENPPTNQLAPPALDPLTGEPEVVSNKRITSRDNRVYVGEMADLLLAVHVGQPGSSDDVFGIVADSTTTTSSGRRS